THVPSHSPVSRIASPCPPRTTLFTYTTLFRSHAGRHLLAKCFTCVPHIQNATSLLALHLERRSRMQTKRTFKYVAALSVGALALTACGGGGDNGGDTADGEMVINAHGTEPQNPLVPTNTNEVGGGHIVDAIFAGLVSYATDGSTELEVAESIESEDNLTWTIKLKDGWPFADGTPVTANSFVDAWSHGANPETAQLNAYFFNPIEGTDDEGNSTDGETLSGLEVIDDLTFEVTLKEAAADFPDRLGYSAYFPLPEVAFEDMEAFGEKPISNGPYVLDEWNHDVDAVLSTNPDYEGNRTPQNDGLTFKFYTDPDAAYTD